MKDKRDARNEKDLYKKMMSQTQKIDNSKKQLNESVQEVPKVYFYDWLFFVSN